ncbi:Uncharacterised protein [Bordetella pertussis]|nr:Uncharacterised protein [Bordetella pertussis]CPN65544.1 Uncharacterised protein [Bordetella pertussis]CPO72316.1 Uncharacterised protein [Bordetella pertussis]CRE30707.1 Uncharacterised protein [Bordetella pertussis]CRE30927.1 Uncharacterised protein [Bordetella pertussis]
MLGIPLLERRHVIRGRRSMRHAHVAQIVRQRTRSDHQHAVIAQRRQRLAQRILAARVALHVQRQLHDRQVGVRIQVAQRHPGAMVERTPRIVAGLDAGVREHVHHLLRQSGRSLGRVLQLVQVGGKAAEIVPGDLAVAGRDRQALPHPVRRNHQHRTRALGQPVAPGSQRGAGAAGLDREHGGTVGNEQCGQAHGDLRQIGMPYCRNFQSSNKSHDYP